MSMIFRTLHPEVKLIDATKGIVDYVASDESIDNDREIIRSRGWRFNKFEKNAPFLDSHMHKGIGNLLGKVIDFRVENGQLINRVQWAVDVPDNALAQLGWKMTEAGYLKAVSVGADAFKVVTKGSREFSQQIRELGVQDPNRVKKIYDGQEQVELSAVIIGSNPNAIARAYKAEAINDEDMETITKICASQLDCADVADHPGDATEAPHRRERLAYYMQMKQFINH